MLIHDQTRSDNLDTLEKDSAGVNRNNGYSNEHSSGTMKTHLSYL